MRTVGQLQMHLVHVLAEGANEDGLFGDCGVAGCTAEDF
ncbi:MAG: hypothetical protein CM15mP23_08950 [Cryomorphaceae bacterium]|nr:MAG: hypothetical protein CM15mP23_08950 [Cryomorphaceae bacterium]